MWIGVKVNDRVECDFVDISHGCVSDQTKHKSEMDCVWLTKIYFHQSEKVKTRKVIKTQKPTNFWKKKRKISKILKEENK